MAGENSLNELRSSLIGYLNDYHNSQTDNYKKGDIRYYYNKPYGIDINFRNITQIKIFDVHVSDYKIVLTYNVNKDVTLSFEGKFRLIDSYVDLRDKNHRFFGFIAKFISEKLEGFNSIYFSGLKNISNEIIGSKIDVTKQELSEKHNTKSTPPDSNLGDLITIEENVKASQKLHRRVGKDNYLYVDDKVTFILNLPNSFKFQKKESSLQEILSNLNFESHERFDGGEDGIYEYKYLNYFITHQINNGVRKYSNNDISEEQFLSRFEKIVDACKAKLQSANIYSDEYRSYRSDYLTKRKELLKFLLLLVYIAKHNINVELDIFNDYILIDVENFYYCKEEDYFRFFDNANILYQKNKQLMEDLNIKFNEENLTYCVLTEDEKNYVSIYYLSRFFDFFVSG